MSYREIEGWFDYENYYNFVASSCPQGSVLVEVGSWLGKSVVYLAEALKRTNKDVTVFAVDTWHGSPEHQTMLADKPYGYLWHQFVKNIKDNNVSDIVVPVCMSSVEAARYFEEKSVYMVFIDATHEYEPVKSDITAWKPKVQTGGILSGHDYDCADVNKAVREMLPTHQNVGSTWIHILN